MDKRGNEIIFKRPEKLFTRKLPGPWKDLKESHEPTLKTRVHKEGLESIRIVELHFDHPMKADDRLGKIYALDKDDQVVGYKEFEPTDKTPVAEIRLNGVINHIWIYVQCSKHGTWLSEAQF